MPNYEYLNELAEMVRHLADALTYYSERERFLYTYKDEHGAQSITIADGGEQARQALALLKDHDMLYYVFRSEQQCGHPGCYYAAFRGGYCAEHSGWNAEIIRQLERSRQDPDA